MSKKGTYASLAFDILRKAGKPMHYKAIIKEALKHKKSNGKTPAATLRTAMKRDKRFVRVKKATYGLKEWENK